MASTPQNHLQGSMGSSGKRCDRPVRPRLHVFDLGDFRLHLALLRPAFHSPKEPLIIFGSAKKEVPDPKGKNMAMNMAFKRWAVHYRLYPGFTGVLLCAMNMGLGRGVGGP